jgi:hypothetical protein
VNLPDAWARATPIFDDDNLVSFAGLAPVMATDMRPVASSVAPTRDDLQHCHI